MHLHIVVGCKTHNCRTVHVLTHLGEKGETPAKVAYWMSYPLMVDCPDYQVATSDVEAERDRLRVGDHYVRVLTIKEAISETKTKPLQAHFCVVTEWVPIRNSGQMKCKDPNREHRVVS